MIDENMRDFLEESSIIVGEKLLSKNIGIWDLNFDTPIDTYCMRYGETDGILVLFHPEKDITYSSDIGIIFKKKKVRICHRGDFLEYDRGRFANSNTDLMQKVDMIKLVKRYRDFFDTAPDNVKYGMKEAYDIANII
jgi:hypothetical protein